jgi:hypothetical protein
MRTGFFKRLRERQEQRQIERARREGFEAGRKHAEIIGRVEWAAAALATAQRTGDVELIRKASEAAVAAKAEMDEMHRNEIAENERLAELIWRLQEGK